MDILDTITRRNSTFSHAINSEDLPAELHDVAARYEEYDDKAGDALSRFSAAKADTDAASLRDALALKEALLAGKKDPGTQHADKAAKELADAERQYTAYTNIAKEASGQLIAGMRERRDQIASIAAEQIDQAVDQYEEAVAKAEEELNEAATIVDTSAGVIGLIDDIDSRSGSAIGYAPVNVPRFDATAARATITKLRERLDTLHEPAEPEHRLVRLQDGRLIPLSTKAEVGS